jgi:hypothetical protein
LPPETFSPNWRGFWALRAKDGRRVKEDIHLVLYERFGTKMPRFDKISLKFIVVVPDRRARDYDNFISRTKPLLDSIRDDYVKIKSMPAQLTWTGLVADDTPKYICRPIDLEFRYEKGEKKTIIEITPIGGRII